MAIRLRDRRETTFAEALQNCACLVEEVVGAFMLAFGYKRERSGEHVGGEEFHASLDDGWVGRNRRGGACMRACS